MKRSFGIFQSISFLNEFLKKFKLNLFIMKKFNKRSMAKTITGEKKKEGQRKAKR